jgi:hypothetical protein
MEKSAERGGLWHPGYNLEPPMLLLASLLLPAALACPTVVPGTPSQLSFDTAQIAIARQGDLTTFSVSINPAGDPQDFALVLPVPEVLAQEQVRTLDGALFARLDAYTAPRFVRSPCQTSDSAAGGNDGGGGEEEGGTGEVVVEASYLVGDYEVVILSAEESDALIDWLNANGYQLPEGAGPMVQEYIDQGVFFLAAKVAPEAALADGSPLAPLQIAYRSELFSIPIRLATLNSPGVQDMVIYTVTSSEGGEVGISNYPAMQMADACIMDSGAEADFSAWYEAQFTESWAASEAENDGAASYLVEFADRFNQCNPCTSALEEGDVEALGFATANPYDTFITRLRFRYTPEQATGELSLYESGRTEATVTSFAVAGDGTECLETCATAEEEPAGEGSDGSDGGADGAVDDPDTVTEPKGGCATAPSAGLGAALVGLLGLLGLRRRRAD